MPSSTSHRGVATVMGRKKDAERLKRQQELREELQELSKVETARAARSHKHNVCLDMLQEGFHASFRELYNLIRQQNEREAVESTMPLQDQQDKLTELKTYLTKAEAAWRQEKLAEAYESEFHLAEYFHSPEDQWLREHFLGRCLDTAGTMEGDRGCHLAHANHYMGRILQEMGEFDNAREHLEASYELSKNQEWTIADGTGMHAATRGLLSSLYLQLADLPRNKESQAVLLDKAYDMAIEGSDKASAAEVNLKRAMVLQEFGNHQEAMEGATHTLGIYQELGDNEAISKTYGVIATLYELQGNIEESIKYLKMLEEIALKREDKKTQSLVYHRLGAAYNAGGDYKQAAAYMKQAVNVQKTEGQSDAHVWMAGNNRLGVDTGLATAHLKLEAKEVDYSRVSFQGAYQALHEAMIWKNWRGEDLSYMVNEKKKNK